MTNREQRKKINISMETQYNHWNYALSCELSYLRAIIPVCVIEDIEEDLTRLASTVRTLEVTDLVDNE